SGPAWLFDTDSLSQTMNYHPVLIENQTNSNAGFQDTEKTDEKSVSPDIYSSSCGDQTREQGDKAENKDKGKSHVVTITGFRDLNEEFEECINNSSNGVNAAGSLVFAAGLNFTNNTNDFSAAGPLNAAMPNMEDLSHNADDVGPEADINNTKSIISVSLILTARIHKDHPTSQIIGDMSSTTQTKKEPKRIHQALKDPSWIEAMQEELLHFKMQKVWILVDLPYGKRAIGTKWVYRNKKDERGIVIRNKATLVTQGHTQEEGIDYEEVFSPVARVKAIRLFLAYASFIGFPVYQMDVKSTFLYDTIKEEVYVCQPPGFEDPEYPDKVYKVVKALYGLHQAPRAWCDNEKRRVQANEQIKKFYEIFKEMSFEISFTDTLILMPKFASTLKALIENKEKLSEMARTTMNEHCSAVILNKLPRKLGDPGKFLIPCEFPGMDECLALADLGASINLMPLSVSEGLSLPELTPTCMTFELADRSVSKPIGIAKDVSFKVRVFHFPADFVVVDFEPDPRVPLILESGTPTPHNDLIISATSPTLTPFGDSDFLLFEEANAFLGLEDDPDSPKINPFYHDPEGDIILLEVILNSEPSPSLPNQE
nr:putative reverse transcriptase, RNA-dependent DNA polymerase [Tanacetum cinerariifolium]